MEKILKREDYNKKDLPTSQLKLLKIYTEMKNFNAVGAATASFLLDLKAC